MTNNSVPELVKPLMMVEAELGSSRSELCAITLLLFGGFAFNVDLQHCRALGGWFVSVK